MRPHSIENKTRFDPRRSNDTLQAQDSADRFFSKQRANSRNHLRRCESSSGLTKKPSALTLLEAKYKAL